LVWWYKLKRNALNADQKQLNYIRIRALMEREVGYRLRGFVQNVVIHIMLLPKL